jgi:Alpha galactosidase A
MYITTLVSRLDKQPAATFLVGGTGVAININFLVGVAWTKHSHQLSWHHFPIKGINKEERVRGTGLKLGIYSDTGFQTCAKYVASGGHEVEDAIQFAEWGVDLLKYDNCWVQNHMVSLPAFLSSLSQQKKCKPVRSSMSGVIRLR